MLKVGLIGCGGMGTTHGGCYGAMQESVAITAVADLEEEKATKVSTRFGGEIYSSGIELIENADVDMVDICVPTYLHTELAVAAMKKGLHVFIEKPVCMNTDEAKLLLETQKETGVKVQVGQVVRFWDEYVWLKETVKNGTYGKLLSAIFNRRSARPKWSWNDWYHKPECSGSMALDMHIHDVDFIRFLMEKEPNEVFSRAVRNTDGVIEQIFTTYSFDDVVITSEGGWDFAGDYPFEMQFNAKLEEATIVFDGNSLVVYPKTGGKITPELSRDYARENDIFELNITSLGAYYTELKHFCDCISNDVTDTIAPLSEAVKSLELALKEINIAGGVVKND